MVRREREDFNKTVFQDISVCIETHRTEPWTHILQTYWTCYMTVQRLKESTEQLVHIEE